MTKRFRHKGLHHFFTSGSTAGISANHARRLRLVQDRLDAATDPIKMDLPGQHLQRLLGNSKDRWSVRVSGNWRVTFELHPPDAYFVNYEDYH